MASERGEGPLKNYNCTKAQYLMIIGSSCVKTTEGVCTMNRIQRLFELLAGISQEERQRWMLAQKIYSAPHLDVRALRTPACWRRKINVRGARH